MLHQSVTENEKNQQSDRVHRKGDNEEDKASRKYCLSSMSNVSSSVMVTCCIPPTNTRSVCQITAVEWIFSTFDSWFDTANHFIWNHLASLRMKQSFEFWHFQDNLSLSACLYTNIVYFQVQNFIEWPCFKDVASFFCWVVFILFKFWSVTICHYK